MSIDQRAPVDSPQQQTAVPAGPGRFVTGSIRRHLLVMTLTSAFGLMAIFFGDLAGMLFLSWLGDENVLAAVGYASAVLFVMTSAGIGLSIAVTANVAPAIGAGDLVRAKRLAGSALYFAFGVSAVLAVVLWFLVPYMLGLLGAQGRTLDLGARYLRISLITTPFLALGMAASGILRSLGDAQRAMHVTLAGAAVTVLFDPILIFWAGLGLDGAAHAGNLGRIAFAAVGLYGVLSVHRLFERPSWLDLRADAALFALTAVPAVATNVATPFSSAYTTSAMASYGDAAVAATAVGGRVMPVAFGALFALSSAVGPVLGQNLGAGQYGRMRDTLVQSLYLTLAFTIAGSIALALLGPWMAGVFKLTGEAAALFVFQCRWLAPLFIFLGILYVANAAFNTMKRAHFATGFNWGRATLGTVPFVVFGGYLAGAKGVLTGQMLGAVPFALGAIVIAFRVIQAQRKA
jgi:putative MATE family efflux protein